MTTCATCGVASWARRVFWCPVEGRFYCRPCHEKKIHEDDTSEVRKEG